MRGMDLTGMVFGRLYVSSHSHSANGNFWNCRCECGNQCVVSTSHLRASKGRISCGCLNREIASALGLVHGPMRRIHGLSNTSLKDCYRNMIDRCYSRDNKRFSRYGGRGIRVCDEWRSSRRAFYDWAVNNGWSEGLSIERKNLDGDYSPENCIWISMAEQQGNTSRNLFFEWRGKKSYLAEICREEGVSYMMVYKRIKKGMGIAEAIRTPPRSAHD